jgi:hypothetical protein
VQEQTEGWRACGGRGPTRGPAGAHPVVAALQAAPQAAKRRQPPPCRQQSARGAGRLLAAGGSWAGQRGRVHIGGVAEWHCMSPEWRAWVGCCHHRELCHGAWVHVLQVLQVCVPLDVGSRSPGLASQMHAAQHVMSRTLMLPEAPAPIVGAAGMPESTASRGLAPPKGQATRHSMTGCCALLREQHHPVLSWHMASLVTPAPPGRLLCVHTVCPCSTGLISLLAVGLLVQQQAPCIAAASRV